MRRAAEVKPGDNYRLAPVTQKCAQQVTAEMKSGQSRCEDLVLIKIKSELCPIGLLSPYRETLAASITKDYPLRGNREFWDWQHFLDGFVLACSRAKWKW
jgi:hypothetical protein